MLHRLGRFTVRRRRWVLTVTVVVFLAAGALGAGVFDRLSGGGFDDPGAESSLGAARLEETFGAGDPNLVLLVTAEGDSVDDPAAVAEGARLTEELAAEPEIEQAFSYWSLGSAPPLRSTDGRQALVLARITGDEDEVDAAVENLAPRYTREGDVLDVEVGGQAQVFRQVSAQVESDLQRAETITFPIVLILLILVFGSAIAAGLPLAIAAISVVGTFLTLFLLTLATDVSIFSINLTTALGIGLGIDYSLFIVSRFREELRAGRSSDDAVVRTVETAGRTVLFSGLTVAISLAALLVFPMYFLRSFAYAGIAVVALALVGAIVVLPAMLAALGPRIDRWTLFRRQQRDESDGAWHRIATFVMRRPWPIAIGVIAVLLVIGTPFLGARFGLPDDRVLPEIATSRQVQDEIREHFTSLEASALSVVASGAGPAGADHDAAVNSYAATLSAIDGVARVDASTGSYQDGERVFDPTAASARFVGEEGTWLSVVPAIEPISEEGERLVADVRSTPAPFETLVAGPSAELVDTKASITSRLPLALAIIALVTFALLFLMTGSILVPLKAIVLNLLSLTATFGAMAWIFQDGHLSGLLDFTATGTLDTSMPILMFCIAFGLSMDYEVFLLSRIKEEYDRTRDNRASVAMGLERTGRIVTAAAAILAVVFVAFATSGITFIKMFGVGMALAVIMDATLIRAALVPAFMRLAGRANWWAPGPLRRLHARIGLREASDEPVLVEVPEAATASERVM
jgi:RND superfamily putative drug exporter